MGRSSSSPHSCRSIALALPTAGARWPVLADAPAGPGASYARASSEFSEIRLEMIEAAGIEGEEKEILRELGLRWYCVCRWSASLTGRSAP